MLPKFKYEKNEFGRSFTLCELWSSTQIPFLVWQRVEKTIPIESNYKIIRHKKICIIIRKREWTKILVSSKFWFNLIWNHCNRYKTCKNLSKEILCTVHIQTLQTYCKYCSNIVSCIFSFKIDTNDNWYFLMYNISKFFRRFIVF